MSRKQLPALAALATLKDTFTQAGMGRGVAGPLLLRQEAKQAKLFASTARTTCSAPAPHRPLSLLYPTPSWQEFHIKLICNVHSKQKRGKYQETRFEAGREQAQGAGQTGRGGQLSARACSLAAFARSSSSSSSFQPVSSMS